MPKRPAIDALSEMQPFTKAPISSRKRDAQVDDEIGEFEDAWEDELESDEYVQVAHPNDDGRSVYA